MANILINLISEISGFENFQKCLEVCDMLDFNELLSIDDNTLDKMEIFLQKKCSRMSPDDRNKFLGDRFESNPSSFRFSPATRQRILNIISNLEKIFNNPLISINSNSINELCKRLSPSNIPAISSIPLDSIEVIMNQNYAVNPFGSSSLSAMAMPRNSVSQSKISDSKAFAEVTNNTPKKVYSNIFQKMDSLRENFSNLPDKSENMENENVLNVAEEKVPLQRNILSGKGNINHKQANKRSINVDLDKAEPDKKIRRVSNRLLKELSVDPDKMLPERLRSQRLINKSKIIKIDDVLEIKNNSNSLVSDNSLNMNEPRGPEEHNQTLDNHNTFKHATNLNLEKEIANNGQKSSKKINIICLNNSAQLSDSTEGITSKNSNLSTQFINENKVTNSTKKSSNKVTQNSKKIIKYIDSTFKPIQCADNSVTFDKTKNKAKSWISTTTATMSGDIANKPSSTQYLQRTHKDLQKRKISPNQSQLDGSLQIKNNSPKNQKSTAIFSNDRNLLNISKHNHINSLTNLQKESTVNELKRGNYDNQRPLSQIIVNTNSTSQSTKQSLQISKIYPQNREVDKTPESHPLMCETKNSVISKIPKSSTVQIYIKPDLPKQIVPQRVQLSDVPFQCFDLTNLPRKPSCIRIKRSAQTSKSSTKPVNLSVKPTFQSDIDAESRIDTPQTNATANHLSIMKTNVQSAVINSVQTQQKMTNGSIGTVVTISETIQNPNEKSPVICTTLNGCVDNVHSTQNQHIQNINQQASTVVSKSQTVPISGKESKTDTLPPIPEPSWISKHSFITNRFINSTKHIRPVFVNEIKTESGLATERADIT